MNQKCIFKKITAFMIAIYMVIGNITMVGVQLNKVIAEELRTPEVKISQKVESYVQYHNQSAKGVVLKTSLAIGEDISKQEEYQTVHKVQLEMNVPEINGQKPQRVSIVRNSTLLTNGKENGEISQSYDSNSGLLVVSYENKDNYAEYKENAKDKFEIIYIYGAEAYAENEDTVIAEEKAHAMISYGKEDIVKEKTQTMKIELNENIGNITQIETKQVSDIYKGYMYANEQNKTSYETNYTVREIIEILNNEIVDKIELQGKETNYLNTNEEKVKAKIEYKNTQISEENFKNMLGQDGYIDIYVDNEKYATVKYVQADKDESKIFVVEYSNGEQKESAGKVEYPQGTKQISMITSKPVAEGKLEFIQEKAIQSDETVKAKTIKSVIESKEIKSTKQELVEETQINENGEEVKVSKQIENVINTASEEKEIELKEPTTQMSLEMSNSNLSTLTTNRTTMLIKLNDTNSSCKLFEEGSLEVTLPKSLVSAKMISAKSLYENGLKITSAKIQDGKIILAIEGKQTTYDVQNISGGVHIVLDLELDIQDTTPTHQETIELVYGNEKRTAEVNIVSKAGLLMLSEVTGYDDNNSKNLTLDSNIQKIEVAPEANAKEVVQTLTFVNNYDQKIQQIQMIGRIGYENEELTSTFDTCLTQPVQVSKSNAKVYYSDKKDATYDDESWQESYDKNAKSYKIVFYQNELEKMDKVEVKLFIELPMNIGYNQNTYIKTEMNYVYNDQKENATTTIGMYTCTQELEQHKVKVQKNIMTKQGDIIPITLAISPRVSQNIVHAKQLVSYNITVENHSNKTLNHIRLEDIIPENAIYTYQEEKQGNIANYIETIQDEKTKLRTWEIETLKANSVKEYEILLTMADVKQVQDIINKVNLVIEDQTLSVESKLTLKPAMIMTSLTTKEEKMIGMTYNKDNIVEYYVKVKNITSEKIKNAKVAYTIPQYLEYVEGGRGEFNQFDGYQIIEQGESKNTVFEYNIQQLKPDEEIIIVIRCKVKRLENDYEEKVTSIANISLEDDIYQTNIKKIEIVQAAFEMSLKADTKGKEMLSKGDTVTYTIQVKNVGKRSAMSEIQDTIPNEIEVSQIDYNIDGKNSKTIVTSTQNISLTNTLQPEETLNIVITGKIKTIEVSEETELIIENVAKLVQGEDIISSNTATFKMKPEWKNEDNPSQVPDIPNTDPEDQPSQKPEEPKTYEINGIAWLDANKDGKRNEKETLLSNIKVTLIDAKKGEIVKDEQGKDRSVTTDAKGAYQFTNLAKGTYLVMFEIDTNQYTVTTYQKTGIYPTENSDVIMSKITMNGEEKLVAITDNLVIESDHKNNIDVGLIENAIFDLSLEKLISKVTVINEQGTKTTEYENKNFVKTDLVAKYMNHTNVIVTYQFIIKNEGDVTGYVNKLVDHLPSGLEFSSELNKDWYKGSDGNLYTTALNEFAIKPGESSKIELVLTKKTTEDTTGTFSNKAEMTQISNLEAIEEKVEAKQNNQSSADIVISIKTGSPVMYLGITLTCIAIIAAGAYMIKKKVLNKGI